MLCTFYFASHRNNNNNNNSNGTINCQQCTCYLKAENLEIDTNLKISYKDEETSKEYRWRKINRFMIFVLKGSKHDQILNFLSVYISASVPLLFFISKWKAFTNGGFKWPVCFHSLFYSAASSMWASWARLLKVERSHDSVSLVAQLEMWVQPTLLRPHQIHNLTVTEHVQRRIVPRPK